MIKNINKKLIISYLLMVLIPLILVVLHIYIDLGGKIYDFNNFLFIYNLTNSALLGNIIGGESELLKFIVIQGYNLLLLLILYRIKFIQKNIILYTGIFTTLTSIIGITLFGILMSV